MKFRLILDGYRNAYENMAIDEAFLIYGKPTLRFYKWKPSAISIGYFQSMEEEVNIEECRKHGIDVVRRITGGGAVYHDENGEITYSFICPQNFMPSNILKTYKVICSALSQGLQFLGMEAKHSGINDVVVNGKKISGSAQTRKYGNILQHGTILLKVNVEKMFSLLRVSKEKIKDKAIKSAKKRVTSIKDEIGKVNEKEVIESLVRGFEEIGIEFYEESMEEKEEKEAKRLVKKYESKEWNFKR